MSETEEAQVQVLHAKIDKLLLDLTDLRVAMAEMSTAQKFMVEGHKSRIEVEKEINERVSAIENKFNYATGLAVAAATVISFLSTIVSKKMFG